MLGLAGEAEEDGAAGLGVDAGELEAVGAQPDAARAAVAAEQEDVVAAVGGRERLARGEQRRQGATRLVDGQARPGGPAGEHEDGDDEGDEQPPAVASRQPVGAAEPPGVDEEDEPEDREPVEDPLGRREGPAVGEHGEGGLAADEEEQAEEDDRPEDARPHPQREAAQGAVPGGQLGRSREHHGEEDEGDRAAPAARRVTGRAGVDADRLVGRPSFEHSGAPRVSHGREVSRASPGSSPRHAGRGAAVASSLRPAFLGTLDAGPCPAGSSHPSQEQPQHARRPRPTHPPGRGSDGSDDVYVVDTRRSARASRGSRDTSAAAAPPPPPVAGAYDEYGRPLPAGAPGGRGADRGGRPPREPRPPRERRPGGARRVVRVVVALLALWLVFLVATPAHAWTQVTREDTTPGGDRPASADGSTYLLVGSDSREGLTAAERKALGVGGNASGRRTDSIILVHTPGGSGKPVVVSIPRDSYLEIPGKGRNKVNAAFAIGGPKLLAETLEQATGLPIDGYVEIGFGGFAKTVDSLDGVEMCVPRAIKDDKAHIDLKKGCQTLDGKNALGYVRARYSDPKGDLGRAERQRQFLGAVMKKAATPSTVLLADALVGVHPRGGVGRHHRRGHLAPRHLPDPVDDAEGVVRPGAQPRRAAVVDERLDQRRQLGPLGRGAGEGLLHDAARGRVDHRAPRRHRRRAQRPMTTSRPRPTGPHLQGSSPRWRPTTLDRCDRPPRVVGRRPFGHVRRAGWGPTLGAPGPTTTSRRR